MVDIQSINTRTHAHTHTHIYMTKERRTFIDQQHEVSIRRQAR